MERIAPATESGPQQVVAGGVAKDLVIRGGLRVRDDRHGTRHALEPRVWASGMDRYSAVAARDFFACFPVSSPSKG